MPSTITDSSTWGDVSGPLGADIRNASAVRNILQGFANRTRFLYDWGFPLANLATLTALPTPAENAIRSVKSCGRYQYLNTGGMLPVDGVLVLNADVPDGVHQWVHEIFLLQNAVSGFASIAPDGKVSRNVHRGWIANAVQAGNAGDPTVTAQAFTFGTYQDATGVSATITGPGTGAYKVIADLKGNLVGAGGTGTIKLVSNDGGGDVDVPLSEEVVVLASGQSYKIGGTFVIPTTAASMTVRLRVKGTAGTVWLRHNACLALQMVEI